jgi:hypothetical protein
VDPVPDPLATQKTFDAGNRTGDLWLSNQIVIQSIFLVSVFNECITGFTKSIIWDKDYGGVAGKLTSNGSSVLYKKVEGAQFGRSRSGGATVQAGKSRDRFLVTALDL